MVPGCLGSYLAACSLESVLHVSQKIREDKLCVMIRTARAAVVGRWICLMIDCPRRSELDAMVSGDDDDDAKAMTAFADAP